MFNSFFRRRQKFKETVAEYARSKQDEELTRIEIPNTRFYDGIFIENLFVSNGRIPINIDTFTHKDRFTVITEDGEVWSSSIRLLEETSIIELKVSKIEVSEFKALE